MSGRRGIDITFTGLRPGEKLEEDLFFDDEKRHPSGNPLISRVRVPRSHAKEVEDAPPPHDGADVDHAGAMCTVIEGLLARPGIDDEMPG